MTDREYTGLWALGAQVAPLAAAESARRRDADK